MNREMRIDAIVLATEPVGPAEDLGIDDARLDPERYLLIEQNIGRAAHAQSHWFSTHESLDAAWAYHEGQEYAEDWSVVRAVDLDTGASYAPGTTTVTWHQEEVVTNGNDR